MSFKSIYFAMMTSLVSVSVFASETVCKNETPKGNNPYYAGSANADFRTTTVSTKDFDAHFDFFYFNFDPYPDGNHPNACRPAGYFYGNKLSAQGNTYLYQAGSYSNNHSMSKTCNNQSVPSFDRAVVTVENGQITHISLSGGIIPPASFKCTSYENRASIGFGQVDPG